jgi:hypothetical protein
VKEPAATQYAYVDAMTAGVAPEAAIRPSELSASGIWIGGQDLPSHIGISTVSEQPARLRKAGIASLRIDNPGDLAGEPRRLDPNIG